MAKYRKKPVVIEAFLFKRNAFGHVEAPSWMYEACAKGVAVIKEFRAPLAGDKRVCEIKTLEGVMTANEGDYIIRGVEGELYPCKADIFEKTYERVTDDV